MFAEHGFYLLFLSALLSFYGAMAALVASKFKLRSLWLSSRLAASSVLVISLISAGILWHGLFVHDYAIAYVLKNSSNDLPFFYKITAFWSSLEGSHFLWVLLLSITTNVALWSFHKTNEHIMPYVSAFLQTILCWMYYLAITYSDPFVRVPFPPSNGQGMNALLQNPYMAIHPPMLFIGYTTLAIPAAYAVAALFFGDVTTGWLQTTRRWTLVGWTFLTAAITLGGRWAYVELGWAGYWAWDPVENSSLIPWLFATAALHSLILQDKLGQLKKMTIVLSVMAFFMGFFGTFITRSGIISSVHSFAQSPIGPNYLYFIGSFLVLFLGLFIWRSGSFLPEDSGKSWGFSKESALVVTLFALLASVAIVVVGTLFPIVSEAITGQRISVQAPYFNTFAPYIGFIIIIGIACANIMYFQSGKIPNARTILKVSVPGALVMTALFYYLGTLSTTKSNFKLILQLLTATLIFWSFLCLVTDYLLRLKKLNYQWLVFLKKNLAYHGALLAHLGMLAAILGFIGNYRGIHKTAELEKGKTETFFGYELTFEGIKTEKRLNAMWYDAPLKMSRDGVELGYITPSRSRYPTKPELLHEVGLYSRFWHDLYIVLADFDKAEGSKATVELHLNPTVKIVWWGVILMCLGGVVCLFDPHRGRKSRDTAVLEWEGV